MKRFLLTTTTVSAVVPVACAQVGYHEINQTIRATGSPREIYIDLDTGAFSNSTFSGAELSFAFIGAGTEKLKSISTGGWYVAAGSPSSDPRYAYDSMAKHFGTGDSGSVVVSVPRNSGYLENPDATTAFYKGYWDYFEPLPGFLALENSDGRKAWVRLDYNDTGHATPSRNNTLDVISFNVGSSGYDLHFGEVTPTPVPEPAETAALMALVAGGVAVYHRRRKVKAAA